MKFYNWGPTTIWHNIECVALDLSKSLHPTEHCHHHCLNNVCCFSGAFLVLVLGLGIATTTAFLEFLWVARNIFTAQNVSWNGRYTVYTVRNCLLFGEKKRAIVQISKDKCLMNYPSANQESIMFFKISPNLQQCSTGLK